MQDILAIGDKVRVHVKDYHWHGNGAVGVIEDIEAGEPRNYVTFTNSHADYFNSSDLTLVGKDSRVTACPAGSKCNERR